MASDEFRCGVPEFPSRIWRDVAYETDERGPQDVIFFHLLAVDAVCEH
jgi:hypothetical protein